MNIPSERSREEAIASDVVNEFMALVDEWVADKNVMRKIENLADEFLYMSVLGELKYYKEYLENWYAK